MDTNYPATPGHPGTPPMTPQASGLSFQNVYPICAVSGWLKFLGILNIIVGIIYCITIIGAIVGWIPLWIGILSTRAGGALREGYDTSHPQSVQDGLGRLALIIKIFGVLTIIGLAINVIYIFIIIAALAAGGLSAM